MSFRKVMLILLLLAGPATQARTGEVTTASALRRSADPASPVVVWLRAGAHVTVVERNGSWLRVRTPAAPSAEGWIRMFDVRLSGNGGGEGEGGALSRLFGLFRGEPGKTGGSQVTATIGIRGLTAEALRTARPDHRALQQMEQFASDPRRALHFADEAEVRARRLGYLEERP